MNVIVRTGFEQAYFEDIVQHFSNYAMGTPPYLQTGIVGFYGILTLVDYLN